MERITGQKAGDSDMDKENLPKAYRGGVNLRRLGDY
jgi:hypothetical protein